MTVHVPLLLSSDWTVAAQSFLYDVLVMFGCPEQKLQLHFLLDKHGNTNVSSGLNTFPKILTLLIKVIFEGLIGKTFFS